MIRSILIKLSMVIATIGAVLALGWPWSEPLREDRTLSHYKNHEPVGPAVVEDHQFNRDPEKSSQQARTQTTPDLESIDPLPTEFLIDINHSTARELEGLPGIGRVLAQRILERRSSVGEFHSPEDLKSVKGLGPKRIDKLRPLIRFIPASKG